MLPRKLTNCLFVVLGFIVLAGLGIWSLLPHYPFGASHCCDKALYQSLRQYADDHDGWFPRGEATPEASLSLLYRMEPGLLTTLRGKSISEAVVRARLENGELLTPETCGWHYVEGLRKDDDPRLALFWDKAGLGHSGQRLRNGDRFVCRIIGVEMIPGNQWPEFLAEQQELLSKIKNRDERGMRPAEAGRSQSGQK